ncbi:hypothetical protein AN218_23850 [Streptomyces nanshensis]|uniref:Uncharacterized protein n=1 Tax=Streptomyces nanshensis TaxID=518642 RepID=A0A1E7KYJ0_9ACTN|nr:hypothetical protein AN218_23850 [Streptomyces nanshensis]
MRGPLARTACRPAVRSVPFRPRRLPPAAADRRTRPGVHTAPSPTTYERTCGPHAAIRTSTPRFTRHLPGGEKHEPQ